MSNRRDGRRAARRLLGLLAATAFLVSSDPLRSAPAEGPLAGLAPAHGSTTLLLALDGVPYRVVKRARSAGGFAGWSRTSRLVSTFPSTTHVAFSALLQPFGVAPADGYELRYYSTERNRMIGGSPFRYQRQASDWKTRFDVKRKSLGGKLLVYTWPRKTARREMAAIFETVMQTPEGMVFAHVGSSDALQHLRGDVATLGFLDELDAMLARLKREYRTVHDRDLRVLLYSDHGNGNHKIRNAGGIHRLLRRAGLRVRKRLEQPNDVVAPTFGIVGYGALYLQTELAERAAAAVVAHRGVDVAAWLSKPGQIEVLSSRGRAVVDWRGAGEERRLRYRALSEDPLELLDIRARLEATERLDAGGFADSRDWLLETLDHPYPDGLNRLVDALDGHHIRSRATVLFSMQPGYGLGLRSAHVFSRLQGGRIEGTHGGLDAASSLGFWMTDDATFDPSPGYRADGALAGLAGASTAR